MKKKIFVIEDDFDIRKNMTELVQTEGYPVEAASNGQEGLELLKRANELPSLIMLDLMMPIMDGFEFRRLQLEDPKFADIPVVIMTADGHIAAKKEQIGAEAFLRKPIELDELLELVEKYCD